MEQIASPPAGELDRSFELLAASHRAALARLARRLTGSPEDAEDLLQETLLDAYRAFSGFRPGSRFYSWAARIMTNNHLDRVRRKRHPVVSLDRAAPGEAAETLDLPDEAADPAHLLLRDQMDDRLQTALDALQPAQRATVLLCDVDGATYEEAAQTQACPIGTIRSRLHRAHNALRAFLERLDGGPEPASRRHSRRAFLQMGTAAAAGAALTQLGAGEAAAAGPVRVLIWDSSPPGEKPAGSVSGLAAAYREDPRLAPRELPEREAEEGPDENALAQTDVLVWCGGREPRADRAAAIARRVRDGRLGLVAADGFPAGGLLGELLGSDADAAPPERDGDPAGGTGAVEVHVTAPRHPIARGVEPFHLLPGPGGEPDAAPPRPDVLVFERARPAGGERGWQGAVWSAGRGRVFCFRRDGEAHPDFRQEPVCRIFRNAARWCAGR